METPAKIYIHPQRVKTGCHLDDSPKVIMKRKRTSMTALAIGNELDVLISNPVRSC